MYAITGANGFVGKHLVSYLENKKLKFVKIGRRKGKVDFLINDLNKKTDWTRALKGIEVVFHLAARVHLTNENRKYLYYEYDRNNAEATKKLIYDACKSGVKRIIFLSTIKVNGEKTFPGSPFSLDCEPNPQDAYAISKLNAEKALLNAGKNLNIDITIVRVPLVFGPGVKANFYKLINLINKGIPLPFKNIKNKRSYLYVENLVDFLFKCSKEKKAVNKIFLLADKESLSTESLIQKISYLLGNKTTLFYMPIWILRLAGICFKRSNQINKFIDCLEIDPASSYKTFNWEAPYNSNLAFQKTIDWYLKKLKIERR